MHDRVRQKNQYGLFRYATGTRCGWTCKQLPLARNKCHTWFYWDQKCEAYTGCVVNKVAHRPTAYLNSFTNMANKASKERKNEYMYTGIKIWISNLTLPGQVWRPYYCNKLSMLCIFYTLLCAIEIVHERYLQILVTL